MKLTKKQIQQILAAEDFLLFGKTFTSMSMFGVGCISVSLPFGILVGRLDGTVLHFYITLSYFGEDITFNLSPSKAATLCRLTVQDCAAILLKNWKNTSIS